MNIIVRTAKSSVGGFYSRFADKEAFFKSLAAEWIERVNLWREATLTEINPTADYAAVAVLGVYELVMRDRNFWRAALIKGAVDPPFWTPFRSSGLQIIERVTQLRRQELGRKLSNAEILHIRFAFQMTNGVINNAIVNRPGPVMPETREFLAELVRGFKAVAGFH